MDKTKALKKDQKKSSRRSSKTSPSQQKIVEYSDVSSNELSTPEQGEIPSDGLSVVSDDEITPTPGPATSERSMHHSSIYEPIDDDDDELEKIMDADRFSDSMSDTNKKRKKTKKKLKKGKKSKKKKKRRRHDSDSVEEISDEDNLVDNLRKKNDEPGTPPLDQVSYTPKHKYKVSSPSNYCHINDSPNSIISADDKKEYSSPHTPPMPKKVTEESSKGRNSSLSSSTSNKVSSKKRRASPDRDRSSKDYRSVGGRGGRSRSPYDYDSRRYVERERSPAYRRSDRSPYSNSHKYRSSGGGRRRSR